MRTWYQQAELQNARWAMLGVAGILGAEVLHPDQFWYTAGMPEVRWALRAGGLGQRGWTGALYEAPRQQGT